MPPAGADGWSWLRGRGPTGGNRPSPGSGNMAGTTADREVGSTEAGSLRPGCGRAGEPMSRRPGSGRTAERGARSAKSHLVRQRGPAEIERHTGSNTLCNNCHNYTGTLRDFKSCLCFRVNWQKMGTGKQSAVRKSANFAQMAFFNLHIRKISWYKSRSCEYLFTYVPVLCDTVGSCAAALSDARWQEAPLAPLLNSVKKVTKELHKGRPVATIVWCVHERTSGGGEGRGEKRLQKGSQWHLN